MHQRIGLYGGSFDPVHIGHQLIAHSFLKSNVIDELWVILTPQSPHKVSNEATSFNHRLAMLKLAFEGASNIKILTVEKDLPQPSYTYKTVEHLVSEHPTNSFYYCMGEDSLINFQSWKNPDSILKHVNLLVAKRPNAENQNIDNSILSKTTYVDHEPIDVSSSEIRNAVLGNISIHGLVDEKVESYIRNHKLYLAK